MDRTFFYNDVNNRSRLCWNDKAAEIIAVDFSQGNNEGPKVISTQVKGLQKGLSVMFTIHKGARSGSNRVNPAQLVRRLSME